MNPASLLIALTVLGSLAVVAGAEDSHNIVLSGIDVLQADGFQQIKNKSIGLITNQTGVDSKGHSTLSILSNAPGVKLKVLFSPEHGFAGTLEDESIGSGVYILPGGEKIPLYSLYGSTRAPTYDMLKGLDALVFDIQDIGTRFYTYATTMAMALESAKKLDIEFFVLDRPNPINGDAVEGARLSSDIKEFIAYMPVPTRHGMTMGELARIYNFRARLGARLQVVALKGWRRKLWFDQTQLPWVRPSPNMPDLDSATLYPGIGCFEATNLSVGRGTPIPFRWIGAPWLDAQKVISRIQSAKLPGITFKTQKYTPTKSVFEGEESNGIQMTITDREALKPLSVFAHLITALRDTHPEKFEVKDSRMTLMTGTTQFGQLYGEKAGADAIIAIFESEAGRFASERAPFLLY